MIRKSMPSGDEPMGGSGFPSRQTRNTFARRSCSNKKIERDDDSKKSHHALERFRAKACPGLDPGWAPVRVKRTRQSRASVPIQSERKKVLASARAAAVISGSI